MDRVALILYQPEERGWFCATVAAAIFAASSSGRFGSLPSSWLKHQLRWNYYKEECAIKTKRHNEKIKTEIKRIYNNFTLTTTTTTTYDFIEQLGCKNEGSGNGELRSLVYKCPCEMHGYKYHLIFLCHLIFWLYVI